MNRVRTKPGSAGCAPGSSTTPGSRRRTGICHVSVLCKLIYFRTAWAFLALWLFSIWPLSKCGRYRGTLTSREGVILRPVLKVATPFLNILLIQGDVSRCRIELTVLGLPRLRRLIWDLPWYSPIVIPGCLLVLRTANAWYLRSCV